jgi:DNA repair protein RadC
MRRVTDAHNLAQTTFRFEEVVIPSGEASQVQETASLPPLASPPEFIPVYTVFLRRTAVLSVRDRPVIRCPQDVATVVGDYLKETDREHFVTVLLDTKNAVIGVNTVSVGILDSALVHPREVYKAAILANAAAIVLAHNHPSGDPTPSAEDKRVTERLADVGKLLGIDVMDHIVLGDQGRFKSLKEMGVL